MILAEHLAKNGSFHNIPAGKGLQINMGVTAKKGKPIVMTEFEISFENKAGLDVKLDAVDIYTLDFDRDAKTTLRERACYNLDNLDLEKSYISGIDFNFQSHPVLPGYNGLQLECE